MKELFEFIWNMPMYQIGLILALLLIFFLLIFAAFLRGFIRGWRKRSRKFNEMDEDFNRMKQRHQSGH